MALARIITRSHPCSRELALDLLARGYAVEIVSPEKIPDNIADLELRVDTGPGDQLIASVEAHNGEHSASLEFLHHLKAPMVDFIRRSPEPRASLHPSEETVRLNPEPSEDVELSADAPQLAATIVSPMVETPVDARRDPGFDIIVGARLVLPTAPLPSPPVEPRGYFAIDESIDESMIDGAPIAERAMAPPTRQSRRRVRPAGWFWAALTFAGVVLLALVLAFGLRQTGKTSAHSSEAAPVEKIAAASGEENLLNAPDPGKEPERDPEKSGRDLGQVSGLAVSPPVIKSKGNSEYTPKARQAAKAGAHAAGTSNASRRAKLPHRRGDDLIARDTVTYLDKRTADEAAARAKLAKSSAGKHLSSDQQGGVIAASAITQLK
ncbi:MAG TPA: hypothetical protein VKH18_10800, partial [Terriglobales bacterium]|nr:hypothetical protein [Terriglobales bacterium]